MSIYTEIELASCLFFTPFRFCRGPFLSREAIGNCGLLVPGHGCVVVQSLGCVQLFVTPCPEAHQTPLSSTVSGSWLESMSIGLVMPSNRLTLCPPRRPMNSMKRSRTRAGKFFCLSLLPSVTVPLSRSLTSASGITTSRISAGGWIWKNL